MNDNNIKIHLSRPDIERADIEKVSKVLNTPLLSRGPEVVNFENQFSRYIGSKYAVSVNSGTSALHLIIKSLGIGANDEVITTPFSFIASANCILYEGARPVFVDIDPLTFNIDENRIEEKITKKTKAILAVDVFGYPAAWEQLKILADKYNLKLVEDSCEALGSELKNKKAGNFADAAAFGFYPNKQITTGEGGIIVTDVEDIAEACRIMRNHGRVYDDSRPQYKMLGYNYRISDINCALGLSQLQRIDKILSKRSLVAESYNKALSDLHEIAVPYFDKGVKRSWFVYTITLKDDYTQQDRDNIIKEMARRGIECGYYFTPIHLQPFYVKLFNYKSGDFPVAENVSKRNIALPFYNNLNKRDIEYVAASLKEVIKTINR